MDTKKWYTSRTVWLGLITTAVSALSLVTQNELIAQNPALVGVIGTLVGFLNVVLRLGTTTGIGK